MSYFKLWLKDTFSPIANIKKIFSKPVKVTPEDMAKKKEEYEKLAKENPDG